MTLNGTYYLGRNTPLAYFKERICWIVLQRTNCVEQDEKKIESKPMNF